MLKKLLNNSGKLFIIAILSCIFTSCASTQKKIDPQLPVTPSKQQLSDMQSDIKYPILDVYDPWEGFNRHMYKFNYNFDKYFYLPIVSGYEFIMPDFLEDGVSNFFNNIGELKNFTNAVLQLNVASTGKTLGRFAVNTTLGIGGLFDVATDMGIRRQNEDFGQTLGFYSIGPGPYVVLPIFGPSTLRDTVGLIGDTALRTAVYDAIDPLDNASHKNEIETGIQVLEAIDTRHVQSFRYYETGSPFEYELIRFLYLTKRKFDIGNIEEKQID